MWGRWLGFGEWSHVFPGSPTPTHHTPAQQQEHSRPQGRWGRSGQEWGEFKSRANQEKGSVSPPPPGTEDGLVGPRAGPQGRTGVGVGVEGIWGRWRVVRGLAGVFPLRLGCRGFWEHVKAQPSLPPGKAGV